ncbi:phage tailspike protein [Escherichia coli]|nr:phage tailspike protein [Escherichia coli]
MTDITANVVVSMPSQLFTMARSFKAVANGKIYIGKIDTDPVNPENRIQVYVENEDGSHVPVSQPIIINAAGYPVYNGQIAKFVTVQGHSMAVYDAYGAQQFYFPNVLKYDPDQFEKRLSGVDGFKLIGQVDSFDELRTIVPEVGGQRILLASYYSGGRTGGGEFIARSTVGMSNIPSDDGGVIATVNSSWYWERVDQDNATVEDFGAIPYIVPDDGSVAVGAVVASDAFQRMFDSLHRITVADGNNIGYLIDAPIKLMSQLYWKVDLKSCVLAKTTTTTTGFATYIAGAGAYIEGNINCVFFIGGTQCRYWEMQGGYIDCHLAPIGDRPTGIYIAEAVGYKIEKVLTKGCKSGLWVKSAWLGEINLCRFSENTNHGVFYDSTRFTSTGAVAPAMQTATSLHVSSSYVAYAKMDGWHMESCQYINFQSSACDGAGSIAGGSAYYFSECDVVGDIGAESPSSSATAYLQLVGGTATLCLNTYDAITTPNPVVLVGGQAVATISLSLRTQRARLFTIQGAKSYIRVPRLTFWNGSTTTPAGSLVDPGSFLRIESSRDTNGYLDFTDGKMQRSNGYTAAYQQRPSSLTPFAQKEARYGVPAGSSTVMIPLVDLMEIFPNFNRSSNTFIEWLQVSTRNGVGITYGAIVACTANTIIGSKVDSQISTGNGSQQAVVREFSVSDGNLVITYAGAITTDSIVILRPQ